MRTYAIEWFAARLRRSAADLRGAQSSGWTTRDARRPDCHCSSDSALRFAGTLLSAALPGAVYSQGCSDLAIGDSADDAGDVTRVGAMKTIISICTFGEVSQ